MNEDNSTLGYVPRIDPADLESNIRDLESRLAEAESLPGGAGRERATLLRALLRNRHNLMELLRSGRFI